MENTSINQAKLAEAKLNAANVEHFEEMRKALVEYKIEYTEESIDFVINKLNKSFEDTVEYSDEHLKLIYMCGLPSHDRKEALKLMGDLRKKGIPYRNQHLIMVDILRKDHFFMDTGSQTNFLNLWTNLLIK